MVTNISDKKISDNRKTKIGHLISKRISLLILPLILLSGLIIQCENKETFYRPNLPEKLCIIGIIDADECYQFKPLNQLHNKPIARVITIEKSYQSEYPQDKNDSLREFSFSIFSSEKEVISFKSNSTIKELKDFSIPANIEFRSGEYYIMYAREKNMEKISAISYVPEPPSKPELILAHNEEITFGCPDLFGNFILPMDNIKFSFKNDTFKDLYYAVLVEGIYEIGSVDSIKFALSYEVKECNSPGFFAEFSGYTQFEHICKENLRSSIKTPLYAYFIEGNKIPDNRCTISISTFFQDIVFANKWIKKYKIKLLSIPEELFLYAKSLNIYDRNSADPFSEPVYLNGNIKGGNGVFAICRSSELIVNYPIIK